MGSANGRPHDDPYRAARLAMVRDQLESRGITDPRVLEAMRAVPRHRFVAPEWHEEAYSDRPLPIGEGQTISQPFMVAFMIQCLALPEHARVLEVGTGSGYQAAVLSRLADRVYTVEYFPSLASQARALLRDLGYTNVEVVVADGSLGLPAHAPYDGIVVAAAAPHVPPSLRAQLADPGRLVIPVGDAFEQELLVITRQGTTFRKKRSVPCRFVPLLGQEGWPQAD